jgi:hypothetical protein
MLLGDYQGLQSTKIWLLYLSNFIGCSEYTLGIAILKALFESAMILRWPNSWKMSMPNIEKVRDEYLDMKSYIHVYKSSRI